ncbi:hypothetical protein ACV8TG_26710, partial [Citrobacter freundii]
PAYGPQNDVTLKMPAFEWVHVQLHQQKGMISLSPPTICNSALLLTYEAAGGRVWPRLAHHIAERLAFGAVTYALFALDSGNEEYLAAAKAQLAAAE